MATRKHTRQSQKQTKTQKTASRAQPAGKAMKKREKTIKSARRQKKIRTQAYPRRQFASKSVGAILQSARVPRSSDETSQMLKAIWGSIQAGILLIDKKTHLIVNANPIAIKMIGAPNRKIIGASCANFIRSCEETSCPLDRTGQMEQFPNRAEHTLTRADGKNIPIIKAAASIRIGTRGYSLETFIDISALKKTEATLRKGEERFRTILDQIEDGYYEIDIAGNITFFNEAFSKISGYSKNELIGMNYRQYMDEDAAERAFETYNRVLQTREPSKAFDWTLIRKGGAIRFVESSISLIHNAAGKPIGFRGIVRDITERRQIENEKETMQAQLIQAQKMEALGLLAAGVAHDFNNMLTAIEGNAELAMMKIDESNPLYNYLNEISTITMFAAELTSKLLIFSRKQPLEPTLLNLNHVVEETLKMLKRLISEDIIIETDLEQHPLTIRADSGGIEQIIMNIAINARDAMLSGGTMTIKTKNCTLTESEAKKRQDARGGDFICLSISDTGIGMDEATKSKIFQPFFTTKKAGKGTGLGLSTVYGIVKQHEGWIEVESKLGHGSTFIIYLPAFSIELEESAEDEPLDKLKGASERILLVEDEAEVRSFLEKALSESGYIISSAGTAEDALECFDQEKGNFSLVFTDVVLPAKSGLELIEELHKRSPDLAVLLSSGYADEKSQWPIIREKGYPFLQKPYTLSTLLKKVRQSIKNQNKDVD